MENELTHTILWTYIAASVACDLKWRKIPNTLTAPALLIAFTINTVHAGTSGLAVSAQGLAAGAALMMLPYILGGIGGGDVKMLAAIGTFAGPQYSLNTFLFGAVAGGFIAAGAMMLRKNTNRNVNIKNMVPAFQRVVNNAPGQAELTRAEGRKKEYIPYACALAAGAAAAEIFARFSA